MDTPKSQAPSQHFDQVKNSAVSNTGDAFAYNIAGDQHIYHHTSLRPWIPPLMLPPRAHSFVGRDEDITWLLHQLTSDAGKTLTLCGPGGMGKTALAAEALNRLIAQENWTIHFPDGIFYHSFYTYPSLPVAFEELARIFEEEVGTDPRRAATRALSRRCMLLVFDGVEILPDALPLRELGGKSMMLLLSRRQSDAPDWVHRRTLDELTPDQAITLLQNLAGPRAANRLCAEQLVKYIGGYPLALQLIGSYLFSRQEEVADYLRWFEQAGLAAIHYGEHQTQSVPMLLQRTYDSLTSDEQCVFLLLGLLAPAPFPLELVQVILDLPEQVVRQTIGSLVNLSLLRRPDLSYEVSHPLIHTFATEYLSSQRNVVFTPFPDTRERILTTMTTHFDRMDPDIVALTLWQPHILPLLSANYLTPQQCLRAAHLFNAIAFTVFIQERYTEAEPLYQQALAIHEHQLGTKHLTTAGSLNNLAELYRYQGRYTEAEPLYQQALAIHERQLGTEHLATAGSLSNLAQLYKYQGKYAKAELLFQRALAIWERQLGATNLATAIGLNNLAELYRDQGRYTEAEPLFQRALTINEQDPF